MKAFAHTIKDSLLQLLYPHVCAGCGSDALTSQSQLCVQCIHKLPFTGFEKYAANPIEKILYGRVRITNATAQMYFTKEGLTQRLMHQFKYKGNKDLGRQLGVIIGAQLMESGRFSNINALVPLPLFDKKEHKRGYNQSRVLCEGIAEVTGHEIIDNAVIRHTATETQTKKSRVERWKNIEGRFRLINPGKISNKHVLLIDDVITTGATIEACAHTLLEADNVRLSVATLCFASNI